MKRKPLMAAVAVAAVALAALYASGLAARGPEAGALRPNGLVITSRVTSTDQAGNPVEGTEQTFYDLDTGEYRTVKLLPHLPPAEYGFTRREGGVRLAGDPASRYVALNPKVKPDAPSLPTYTEAQLRAHPQLAGTAEVAGQTAFLIRTFADPEKTLVANELAFLPNLPPVPVRSRWYASGAVYEQIEALAVERRPLAPGELMDKYDGLPRKGN